MSGSSKASPNDKQRMDLHVWRDSSGRIWQRRGTRSSGRGNEPSADAIIRVYPHTLSSVVFNVLVTLKHHVAHLPVVRRPSGWQLFMAQI